MPTALDRKKKSRQNAQPRAIVDFTAAAHEHVEPAFDAVLANGVTQTFDVPAYGYVRAIIVLVTVSVAGALGTGVVAEDFPFNVLDEVTFLDVNGAPIYGPCTGYDTFLVNLLGGYTFLGDARADPNYSATYTTVNFALRIPVEIHHNNGLGALANQNAAASYKCRIVTSALATQLSTVGTATANTYRIRGLLEAWSQPTAMDLAGRPQAMQPPRHGTSQYWSVQSLSPSAGDNTLALRRVGNLIRNLIFVFRDDATPSIRNTAEFPDPIEIRWDARQLIREIRQIRQRYMMERNGWNGPGVTAALPAGVFAYQFSHDVLGKAGDGTPELWLPTVQSTRLELVGSFGGAGTLRVITNDVAPVEVTQAERFQEASESGFTPEMAASQYAV